jgi:hypothetical protein
MKIATWARWFCFYSLRQIVGDFCRIYTKKMAVEMPPIRILFHKE